MDVLVISTRDPIINPRALATGVNWDRTMDYGGSTFAHTFKECGSFAQIIFPGKRTHLRTQFPQVNVTFAHIRFSLR